MSGRETIYHKQPFTVNLLDPYLYRSSSFFLFRKKAKAPV
jgi:hypothetical protein